MEPDKRRRPSDSPEENQAGAKKQRDNSFVLPEFSDEELRVPEDRINNGPEENHTAVRHPRDTSVEPREHSDEELPVPENRTHTIPDMEDFVDRVYFPDNIGAIICGKQIWDRLLNFFTRININDDTYKRLFDLIEKASSNQQTTPPAPNMEGTTTDFEPCNTETDVVIPDEGLIGAFRSDYAKLKDRLNSTLSAFSARDLRQNTDTKEDYDMFVHLRKDLTTVYKSGQHLLKQLQVLKTTGHINIIKTNTSIIPITIPPDDFDNFQKEIKTTTQKQNIKILNKLLEQQIDKIKKIINGLPAIDPFIVAKAFRTVVLSNKDLSDGNLQKKDNYRREQNREYNRDKHADYTETKKRTNYRDQPQDDHYGSHQDTYRERQRPNYENTNNRSRNNYHHDKQQTTDHENEYDRDYPSLPNQQPNKPQEHRRQPQRDNVPYHYRSDRYNYDTADEVPKEHRQQPQRDNVPYHYRSNRYNYDTADDDDYDPSLQEHNNRNYYNSRHTYVNRRHQQNNRHQHLN